MRKMLTDDLWPSECLLGLNEDDWVSVMLEERSGCGSACVPGIC